LSKNWLRRVWAVIIQDCKSTTLCYFLPKETDTDDSLVMIPSSTVPKAYTDRLSSFVFEFVLASACEAVVVGIPLVVVFFSIQLMSLGIIVLHFLEQLGDCVRNFLLFGNAEGAGGLNEWVRVCV
jgi:hypothetical protein